jgi:malyl-CoA/(S)-citramalyl-CoA lyase
MSFTQPPLAAPRLHRTELAVPGIRTELFEKAARGAADVVFLDLEDSVAPDDKEKARKNVIAAVNEIDWGVKTLSVRVNGMDTHWTYRDIVEVLEACPRVDLLLVPKVGVAADVYALDWLVTQIETAKHRTKRIGFELQIESALGLINAEAIAAASSRNEALCYGGGDFAASIHARTMDIGQVHPDYGVLAESDAAGARAYFPGDQWHAVQARVVTAARAYGLRPIDSPYADFKDTAGFEASTKRAAAVGFEGRMVIHPSQVAAVNRIFSPAPDEVARARRIVEAMAEAARAGRGAVTLDGRMIDAANIRMAEHLIAKADAIEGRA